MGGTNEPSAIVGTARIRVVEARQRAIAATNPILGVGSVIVAPRGVRSEDRDVFPRCGMPVRVVIALLGALKSAAPASWILARVPSSRSHSLVGKEETLVAFSRLTVLVIRVGFVHAVFKRLFAVVIERILGQRVVGISIVWDGVLEGEKKRGSP